MSESAGRHPLLRYTLLQAPDVAVAALVVWALWNGMIIPGWVALGGLAGPRLPTAPLCPEEPTSVSGRYVE